MTRPLAGFTAAHGSLAALAARPHLLLPLDVAGCDGEACPRPAFHDRSTSTWRHLADLSRCPAAHRTLTANPTADTAGRHQ